MKNQSAFPWTVDDGKNVTGNTGMTLRDYFAAKALQGLLANPKLQKEILAQGGCLSGWIEDSAYGFADAMLKAREA
jgi:hypothetical protein